MLPLVGGLRGRAHLDEVVELVEELLGGGVHLGVGLAHVLVERLVVVDRRLEGGDVGRRGHGGRHLAALAPLGDVLHVLEWKKKENILKRGVCSMQLVELFC